MCLRNFFHSQRVVDGPRCMASEHYFLLVALVFFRMSSARGSRAFPRVFACVLIASDHCFLLVALVLFRMSLHVSDISRILHKGVLLEFLSLTTICDRSELHVLDGIRLGRVAQPAA